MDERAPVLGLLFQALFVLSESLKEDLLDLADHGAVELQVLLFSLHDLFQRRPQKLQLLLLGSKSTVTK